MGLPKDINILVSMLNMKLRDDDMSLETIIEINGDDYLDIINLLEKHHFYYCSKTNQIKTS